MKSSKNNSDIILSVIVPFRNNDRLPHLLQRLKDICSEFPREDSFELLIVDSGSSWHGNNTCLEICQKHRVKYVRHEAGSDVFSIGAARDFGVRNALGRFVTFLDVDCKTYPDFWRRVLMFADVQEMHSIKKKFFSIPVFYLSKKGTEKFLKLEKNNHEKAYLEVIRDYICDTGNLIEGFAPCSSIMVLNRHHYLSVGGHSSEFEGHGYEDFELYHRLLIESAHLEPPENYYLDTRNWQSARYEGFRAQFSLLGREALLSYLFAVHLWHPRDNESSFYDKNRIQRNREIWRDIFHDFEQDRVHPNPLIAQEASGNLLLCICDDRNSIINSFRDVIPYIGEILFLEENDIFQDGVFLENKVKKILLDCDIREALSVGDFESEKIRYVYNWLLKSDIRINSIHDGHLPHSWKIGTRSRELCAPNIFDWRISLTSLQKEETRIYIEETRLRRTFKPHEPIEWVRKEIERQHGIIGRRLLFVSLENNEGLDLEPKPIRTERYDDFLRKVTLLASELAHMGWTLICESKYREYVSNNNIKFLNANFSAVDLIEISDAVYLYNSNDGYQAMLAEKRCYIFDDVDYLIDSVNVSVKEKSINQIVEIMNNEYVVNFEKVILYIFQLRNKIYSFSLQPATLDTRKTSELPSRTLDFLKIRIPGQIENVYSSENVQKIPLSAPLYERFRNWRECKLNKKHISKLTEVELHELSSVNDIKVRERIIFQIYRLVYNPFLSRNEQLRLRFVPTDFFAKAKSPASLIGKHIVKKYLIKSE